MIKLGRINTFLFGLVVILLFYFVNRLNQVIGSETTEGRLTHYLVDDTGLTENVYPVVEYSWKGKTYTCRGRENTALDFNKPIPVLLKKGDPAKAQIFTIRSFWLYPLFYVLLPVTLWAAFSLSYIGKNERLMIGWKYPFVKKDGRRVIDGPGNAGRIG